MISFKIRRTIMMKIRMTRTVAHITMPPFFWVLSACRTDEPRYILFDCKLHVLMQPTIFFSISRNAIEFCKHTWPPWNL
jgi:hypothetical protein